MSCVLRFHKKKTLIVAKVLMILRVWAMYNRSKLVLGILLSLFSLEIVSTVVAASINSNPNNMPGMYTSLNEWRGAFTWVSTVTPIVGGYSDHQQNYGLLTLRVANSITHYNGSDRRGTNGAWCCGVRSRNRPVCQAVIPDVSRDKSVATQSVHEFTYQARHTLFSLVRRPAIHFPPVSSASIPA